MESIKDINDSSSLIYNKVIGNPKLINSTVSFTGKNNILFCEDNINIVNKAIICSLSLYHLFYLKSIIRAIVFANIST